MDVDVPSRNKRTRTLEEDRDESGREFSEGRTIPASVGLAGAPGTRWRDLPEATKKRLTKLIRWRGRIPPALVANLTTPQRIMVFGLRKKNKASRPRGNRFLTGRMKKPFIPGVFEGGKLGYGTAARAGLPQGTTLSDCAQAYLTAYGSPFTAEYKLKMTPKIPDPENVNLTASVHYDADWSAPATSIGTALVLSTTSPFGFGGNDIHGVGCNAVPIRDQNSSAGTDPLALAGAVDYVNKVMLSRVATRFTSYNRYVRQCHLNQGQRYVGRGFKVHDIGAPETRSGIIHATHLQSKKVFSALLNMIKSVSLTQADLQSVFMYGLFPLLNYEGVGVNPGGVILGTGYAFNSTTTSTMQTNLRAALMAGTEFPADEGEEWTMEMGCTMRTYTRSAERPFVPYHKQPPAAFDCTATAFEFAPLNLICLEDMEILKATLGQSQDVNVRTFIEQLDQWNNGVGYMPASVNYAPILSPNNGYNLVGWQKITAINGAVSYYAMQYYPTGRATTGSFPLSWYTIIGCRAPHPNGSGAEIIRPLICVDLANLSNGFEGDGDMMFALLEGLPAARQLQVYSVRWNEFQPNADTLLSPAASPTDHGWPDIVRLGNNFPVVTKGFSFFKDLWSGVKKAVGTIASVAEPITRIGGQLGGTFGRVLSGIGEYAPLAAALL